jgi:hypothetical protein
MVRLQRIAIAITLFLGLPLAVYGQVAQAQLTGTVTDPSGASIPNASVTLTNTDTQVGTTIQTTSAGGYIFDFVNPGNYSLTVKASGFRAITQAGIHLDPNQVARIDVALQVGATTQSVEVVAAAPLLQTQTAAVGAVVSNTLVADLPLNGRNFVQLAILTPGVNGTGWSTTGTIMSGTRPDDRRPGSEIFSNGNREGSNDWFYDGVDNNERMNLSVVLRAPIEAISEFKVETNMAGSELGRNSGAGIDVVTKSGTSTIKGSMFEYLRNSATDARSFFQDVPGASFPPYRQNQFGFSLGGPLKFHRGPGRTFFFGDYEGYRRITINPVSGLVPDACERQGIFTGPSGSNGCTLPAANVYDPTTTTITNGVYARQQFISGGTLNIIPATSMSLPMEKLAQAYPAPENSSITNNYTSNPATNQSWNQGDIRIDRQFSDHDNFFARWSIQDTNTITGNNFPAVSIPGLPVPVSLGNENSFAGTAAQPVQQMAVSWVHIFSPTLVNDLRGGYNRYVLNSQGQGAKVGQTLCDDLGIPNCNQDPAYGSLMPIVSPSNYFGEGQSRSLPEITKETTFNAIDELSWTKGRHTIKFGADIRRRQVAFYQGSSENGRFNYTTAFTEAVSPTGGLSGGNSIASMLLGYPSEMAQLYQLVWGGMRGIEEGYFASDQVRASNKLTVTIGLRWEYTSPYSEEHNRVAWFNPTTVAMNIAGQTGVNNVANVPKDFSDWGPRIGLAYRLTGDTVLRAGYGLFSNPNSGGGGDVARGDKNFPFAPVYDMVQGSYTVGPRDTDGFPLWQPVCIPCGAVPVGSVYGVSPTVKDARVMEFNLAAEHEIKPLKMTVTATGLGNLGRHVSDGSDINEPVPGPGALNPRRPFYGLDPNLTSSILWVESDGDSDYYAFELSAKRNTKNFTTLISYTWAHAIDNTVGVDNAGNITAPMEPNNRAADKGNSDFDMIHRFTVSFAYPLPAGAGMRWFSQKGVARAILGGWQTNGFWTMQSGLPFTDTLNTSPLNNGYGSRPNQIANPNFNRSQRTLTQWFNAAAFTSPALYTYGNEMRNELYGPGRVNLDFSLFRDFTITERVKLQFRCEEFNIFNTPQFGNPSGTIGVASGTAITATVGNPRQMQFALRLEF